METLGELLDGSQNNQAIKHFWDVQQKSDQWYQLRCGVITASVMEDLIKKKTDKKTGEVTYSVPDDDKIKAYFFELAAQRVTNDIEDTYQSYAMIRGERDEVDAFNLYSQKYEPLKTCGFITNEQHGVLIGYSPDGLTALNDEGQVECKSRAPKFQAETIFENEMPDDYMIQIQTGLLVTKRKWCDFISYCGGMPMFVKRIYPDPIIQDTIILAAQKADKEVQAIVDRIQSNIKSNNFYPTIKRVEDITA